MLSTQWLWSTYIFSPRSTTSENRCPLTEYAYSWQRCWDSRKHCAAPFRTRAPHPPDDRRDCRRIVDTGCLQLTSQEQASRGPGKIQAARKT